MQKLSNFWMNNNLGSKLASLILAIFVWYGIQKITRHHDTLKGIQIQVLHDDGVSVLGTKPREVAVTFRGTKSDILPLDEDDVIAQVDLRGVPFTESQDIILTEKMIIHAGNSRVVNIKPSVIEVGLDKPFGKKVAVKTKIDGYLEEGYSLDAVIATPEFVNLRGSKKIVESIEAVQTKAIDLTGKGQSFEVDAEILAPSADWTGSIEPASVLVQVSISETFSGITINDVPVKVLMNLNDNTTQYELDSERVSVSLRGDPAAIEKQVKGGINAYIIPTDETSGAADVKVAIAENIRLIAVEPSQIQWSVK